MASPDVAHCRLTQGRGGIQSTEPFGSFGRRSAGLRTEWLASTKQQ
jgi:hypothetical protein